MFQLDLKKFEGVVFGEENFELDAESVKRLEDSFNFLENYASDKVIYGINTGFGPMAQFRISDENLSELQYNLIRSHSTGTGKVLSPSYARSVLLARLNSLLQGKSGVSPAVIYKLVDFLNHNITPEIYEHGSVGASGDLVQLANLGLNLIGEGFVYVNGERIPAKKAMDDAGIEPLKLELRDGLGLINGTSCMTGIGLINILEAEKILNWSIVCSALINEVVESFDDSISQELNDAKCHKGQKEVAANMRTILADSSRMKNRVDYFKNGEKPDTERFEKKVQEYYSIRCVPQILGPVADTISYAKQVLLDELNSTNDNPIVDRNSDGVYHGGNFHGDYVSLEMDKLKMVVVKTTMLCERQLNFLLNPSLNNKFPAFLNGGTLGLNFGLQGAQFTATSTTAESQTLSFPNYVHSIPNNNDNQDIVSMGTNSALITKKVIDNAVQVLSIHLLAICKAIDLLSEEERANLSSHGKTIYNDLKAFLDGVNRDKPLNKELKEIQQYVRTKNLKL